MNQESTQPNTVCSRCGTLFDCEITAGNSQCWCMQENSGLALPVPAAGSAARCMCQACLRSAHAQRAGVFTPF